MGELYSAVSCLHPPPGAGLSSGSSAEGMQVHFHLLAAAQHPHGGVEAPRRDDHLSPAHELPVPREKHRDLPALLFLDRKSVV